MTRLGLISTLVLAVGCGDDAPMDPESSTGMQTSSGSTSTPSTSSSTTEDASSSSSGEETTEESGASTTTTTTTGEPSTESSGSAGSATLEEACTAYCITLRECEGHKGIAMCVEPCVSADASSGAECIDAAIAYYDCLAALSCEDPFATCDDEGTAHYQACTETCSVAITRGEECGADFACPDNDYEITCDQTTCTCWENGAAVGECDADGICNVGDVSEYASECCDFAFD
jgi:hypothetical protein